MDLLAKFMATGLLVASFFILYTVWCDNNKLTHVVKNGIEFKIVKSY